MRVAGGLWLRVAIDLWLRMTGDLACEWGVAC